jgi:acetylornithine deacetylase
MALYEMEEHLVELLRRLVETPSPSGNEEGILLLISDYLDTKGIDYKIRGRKVRNLIIEGNTDFWVVTHLDTFPSNHPFRYDGVYAYGTGVCDAKASIAAIMAALEIIDEINLSIALLSDEEEGGQGSQEFSKQYKGRAVVMEPTDMKIAISHYGCIEFAVRVKGKAAHGSYPEYGLNAIDRAFEMVERLRDLQLPGKMVLMEIKGGDNRHVIPDECYLRVDFTIPSSLKVEKVVKAAEWILKEYGEYEAREIYDGFEEEPFQPFEKALQLSDIKVEYGEMHSWTDAINLKRAGWKAVVWGPGSLHSCHTALEKVKVEDVAKAARVLVKLNELLGDESSES